MNDDISLVGIVGAGTMGREIALQVALAGISTIIYDSSPVQRDGLPRVFQRRLSELPGVTGKGEPKPQIDDVLGRLTITDQLGDLAEVDLISESVFEELAVKQAV